MLAAGLGGAERLGEELSNPCAKSCPSLRVDAVAHARALHLARDQSDLLQLLEVLRDRGLRQSDFGNELPADTSLAIEQVLEDGHASDVGQGARDFRQAGLLCVEACGVNEPHR